MPALARWIDAWYIGKIWQGKYEACNIEAHRNGCSVKKNKQYGRVISKRIKSEK